MLLGGPCHLPPPEGSQPPCPRAALQLHPLPTTPALPPCLHSPFCTHHLSLPSLGPQPPHAAGINPPDPGEQRGGSDGTGVLLAPTSPRWHGQGAQHGDRPVAAVGMCTGQDVPLPLWFVQGPPIRGGGTQPAAHTHSRCPPRTTLCRSVPRHLLATSHLDPQVPGDDVQRCPPTSTPTGCPVGRVGIFRDRPCPHAAPCPHAGAPRPPRFSPPSPRWLGLSRAPCASGSILPIALSSLLINYGSSRKLLLH